MSDEAQIYESYSVGEVRGYAHTVVDNHKGSRIGVIACVARVLARISTDRCTAVGNYIIRVEIREDGFLDTSTLKQNVTELHFGSTGDVQVDTKEQSSLVEAMHNGAVLAMSKECDYDSVMRIIKENRKLQNKFPNTQKPLDYGEIQS